jgi:hypothetical protein
MDENIITWNFANWITIVLMAAIAFALLGFAQNWWATRTSEQQSLAAAA